MAYVAAYQDPDFSQSLPLGGAWEFVEPCYFGALRYRDPSTGAGAVVPAIWYNQPPKTHAKALRYCAGRSDESALHHRTQDKPWSGGEAERSERQARRLRAMALLCEHSNASHAGAVDFMGLDDPSQSREAEGAAVAVAEALEAPTTA